MARAHALLTARRPEEALRLLAKAVAADPNNAHAYHLMALCCLQLGRPGKGLRHAERAIALQPDHEWGHRLRSVLFLGLKKRPEALDAAREAVRLSPRTWEPWAQLAHAQLAMNDLSGARWSGQEAVKLAPSIAGPHQALGLVALREGRPRAAAEAFRRALAIDAESHEALNNLGVALRMQGRMREASELFASASRLEPRNGLAASNAARLSNALVAMAALGVLLLLITIFVRLASAKGDSYSSILPIAGLVSARFVYRWAGRTHRPKLLAFTYSWRGAMAGTAVGTVLGFLGVVAAASPGGLFVGVIPWFLFVGSFGFRARLLEPRHKPVDRPRTLYVWPRVALLALVVLLGVLAIIIVAIYVPVAFGIVHNGDPRADAFAALATGSCLAAGCGVIGKFMLRRIREARASRRASIQFAGWGPADHS